MTTTTTIKLSSRVRLEAGAFELLKAAERAEYFMAAMAARLGQKPSKITDHEQAALDDLRTAIVKSRGW